MTIETNALAGSESPAVDAVTTPVAETETTTVADQGETTAASPAVDDDHAEGSGSDRPRSRAAERIQELVHRTRALEEQNRYFQDQLRKQAAKPAEPEAIPPPPSRVDFADDTAWQNAVMTHAERVATHRAEITAQRVLEQREAQAQQTAIAQSFAAREQAFAAQNPDYFLLTRGPVPFTDTMAQAISVSELGPQVALHLAQNIAEAVRISSLPATRQAVEIGRLEAKLSAPAPKPIQPKVTKAPAPPTPVGSSETAGKDPAKMNMNEYAAWRASQRGIRSA
jgi:hypothetical protein